MELTQVRELAVNTITSNDMQENQDMPNSRVIPSSNESVNAESQVSNSSHKNCYNFQVYS